MASIIRWSEQSADDLEAIFNFIARDSEHYARVFIQRIFDSIERLENFPQSGRMVPEYKSKNIREIILGYYRIIYKIDKDSVTLLTIHHSSKLFTKKKSDLI